MMQSGDNVWLEQRPNVGLWGGLYCFPQFINEDALREHVASLGIKQPKLHQLTSFRHTFSHFHLDIVPIWFDITQQSHCMDEGTGLWYNLAQPPSVGLAAPWNVYCSSCLKSQFLSDSNKAHHMRNNHE